MTRPITMPRLGETMEQGTLRAWLVKPGQTFKRGDVIAEIETDKTTVELPALEDGTIATLVAQVGDLVDVGAPIAELVHAAGVPTPAKPGAPVAPSPTVERTEGPSMPTTSATPARDGGSRLLASPAARRLANSLNIPLADVPGTGPNGRRQGWDVRAYAPSQTGSSVGTAPGPLHVAARGEGAGLPVVFLHGFGGSIDNWTNIQNNLALHRRTAAIDLPGHGKSVGHSARDRETMAQAVAATLAASGIKRAHLVGHSMGGGVAATVALDDPSRVASLFLIAPAAVGREFNRDLLEGFAKARSADELSPLLAAFFAEGTRLPRGLPALIEAMRGDPDHRDALEGILATMDDGGGQRLLDVHALAATDIPTRIVWGKEDRILPFSETDALPGVFALHRFSGVGHSPHLEVPREVIRLIRETIKGE